MAHARQTIREKIVTNVTGLGLTGSNVFDTKLYNLTQANLPALCVYAEAESSEMSNITNNTLDRNLDVVIEAYCEQNDQIEVLVITGGSLGAYLKAAAPRSPGFCRRHEIFLAW